MPRKIAPKSRIPTLPLRYREKLLQDFEILYPDPRSELNFSDEYQLIVSVILSAQCTDKKVNEVTPALFKKYPSFVDLARAKVSDVEDLIRPVNYYRTKAKNIIEMSKKIAGEFGGTLPLSRELLVTLPGVGRKTANVILCEQGKVPAIAVDTHVFRLAHRLHLSQGDTPEKVEQDLMELFDPVSWRNLHHWLIYHGRRVCKAQRPLCEVCPLASFCPGRIRED